MQHIGMSRQPQLPPSGRALRLRHRQRHIPQHPRSARHRSPGRLAPRRRRIIRQPSIPPHASLAHFHRVVLPLHPGRYRRPRIQRYPGLHLRVDSLLRIRRVRRHVPIPHKELLLNDTPHRLRRRSRLAHHQRRHRPNTHLLPHAVRRPRNSRHSR